MGWIRFVFGEESNIFSKSQKRKKNQEKGDNKNIIYNLELNFFG